MIASAQSNAVERTVADYDHIGQVLAARLRVGPGHIHDVLEHARIVRSRSRDKHSGGAR